MAFWDRGRDIKGTPKRDMAVLGVRLVTGGLMAGHGAQKLFGSFNGPGFEGTAGWLESMGFRPGKQWALVAGGSELGGGVLTALGLFHPIGPISTIGAMAVASLTAHRGKPIWAAEGGAELPVTNIAIAAALAMVSPGRHSLDRIMGIRVPQSVSLMAAGAVGLGVLLSELKPDLEQLEQGEGDDSSTPEPTAA